MKGFIILAIILTLGILFLYYSKTKNLKKLFISLGTFGGILALAVAGNITRQVMPLFIAHLILLIFAWGGLFIYLFKDRYYWWILFSPTVTIGLFLIMELLTGSGHEYTILG
ncbi:hypothetical protein PGH07_04680 [Sulfurovum sp. zt1-1]|uniref:Uncharacterized protein n=1 Tax=Sulfurovum zhangzhouensis TaxID=3019067 RepID=A0ABT7QXB4_9BACT|nr:hypothetical protein [Sulfurovum zhangzhouensis]MDM5271465.1 hypothetical protein [Sulfurovum zhangzhouensis]